MNPNRPFLVLGLPRSRTAWLSRFLTYDGWVCGHEEIRHMRSLDDVKAWFSQPGIGSAETAAAPWWRLFSRFAPGVRIVVVRRPVDEVIESLRRLEGVDYDYDALAVHMRYLDKKLQQVTSRLKGVLSVDFSSLMKEDVCAEVFEHCLPLKHDSAHWRRLAPQNIQADMVAMLRYCAAYRPALEKLTSIAKHQSLSIMAQHPLPDNGGLTFQEEGFEAWRRDGRALFEEHLVLVGEAPDGWTLKNIPLMQQLHGAGRMQIMTARCNGRMVGYLVSLISPSMASEGIVSASHTTFFASPDFPGVGMKLQRSALSTLKGKGVDEVFMQDGIRGSGGRLHSMYRRLGAEDNGTLYRLDLKEA